MLYHKSHSKFFRNWCYVLLIAVFVLGIIAGFVFKVDNHTTTSLYEHYSSYTQPKASFNWTLTIIIWLSEVIPAAILYAIYSHLENQEIQIEILNEIRRTTQDIKNKEISEPL